MTTLGSSSTGVVYPLAIFIKHSARFNPTSFLFPMSSINLDNVNCLVLFSITTYSVDYEVFQVARFKIFNEYRYHCEFALVVS